MRVIGIDPDLVASGVAVWVDGQLEELLTLSLLDLVNWLSDQHHAGAHFVLEDVEFNKPVFKRRGVSERAMGRIAQNVGQVKAIARQIKLILDQLGASYTLVPPLKGWFKKAKKDPGFFKKMTGWSGRSNEDKRDAAMLGMYFIRTQRNAGAK